MQSLANVISHSHNLTLTNFSSLFLFHPLSAPPTPSVQHASFSILPHQFPPSAHLPHMMTKSGRYPPIPKELSEAPSQLDPCHPCTHINALIAQSKTCKEKAKINKTRDCVGHAWCICMSVTLLVSWCDRSMKIVERKPVKLMEQLEWMRQCYWWLGGRLFRKRWCCIRLGENSWWVGWDRKH